MDKEFSINLIRALSNAYGATGFEDDVLLEAKKFIPDGISVSEDNIRNLYLHMPGHTAHRPTVLLDGHSDELGFIVKHI